MIARIHKAMEKREGGFTLIELLVVMIIIGILAAVAIPIFMNQQKTSRDTATTSDVKNLATNVQSMLVQNPDATSFVLNADAADVTKTSFTLTVGSGATAETTTISKTSGTKLVIYPSDTPGTFVIGGWNPSGKKYIGKGSTGAAPTGVLDLTGASKANFLIYNSEFGGLQR